MENHDTAALDYLKGTLRRTLPSYPLRRVISEIPRVPPAPGEAAKQRAIELRVKDILKGYLPNHPAYNQQILFTLSTLRKNNVSAMDPAADGPRLAAIINDIHDKRPRARMVFSAEHAAALHTLLEKYQQISGKGQSEFPYLDIVGHRADQRYLKAQDKASTAKPGNDTAKRKNTRQTLRSITRVLDEVCPTSEEFNDVRQTIIEDVLQKGRRISQWISARKDLRESKNRIEFDAFAEEFTAADIRMQDDASWIRVKIARGSQSLRDSGPAKPLTPQDAIAIDKWMKMHLSASTSPTVGDDRPATRLRRGRGGGAPAGAAPAGVSDRPPESIVQTALRPRREKVGANLDAETWGKKCLKTVKEIFPASGRNSIRSRMRFLEVISANRQSILEKGLGQSTESGSLWSLSQAYSVAFKEKEPQIRLLAEHIDNFHKSWTGELQRPNTARQARERRAASGNGERSSPTPRNLSISSADDSDSGFSFAGMPQAKRPGLRAAPAANRPQRLKLERETESPRPGPSFNARTAAASPPHMSPDRPSSEGSSSDSGFSFAGMPQTTRPALSRAAPAPVASRPQGLNRDVESPRPGPYSNARTAAASQRYMSPDWPSAEGSSSESDRAFDDLSETQRPASPEAAAPERLRDLKRKRQSSEPESPSIAQGPASSRRKREQTPLSEAESSSEGGVSFDDMPKSRIPAQPRAASSPAASPSNAQTAAASEAWWDWSSYKGSSSESDRAFDDLSEAQRPASPEAAAPERLRDLKRKRQSSERESPSIAQGPASSRRKREQTPLSEAESSSEGGVSFDDMPKSRIPAQPRAASSPAASPSNAQTAAASEAWWDWSSYKGSSSESDRAFDDLSEAQRPAPPEVAAPERLRDLKRKRQSSEPESPSIAQGPASSRRKKEQTPLSEAESSSEGGVSFDDMPGRESSRSRTVSPEPGRERGRAADRLGRPGRG